MEDDDARLAERVEAIRAELAEITVGDLERRLPEPPGDGTVARLARTANQTLDRLEYAVRQQTQFASGASHGLRTPLAALRAEVEAALRYPDAEDMPDALAGMLGNIDRLEAIVTDLLLLSRIGVPAPTVREPIDLASLVADEIAWRTGRSGAGGSPELRVDLPSGIVVHGIVSQLSRALANLLDNAERHARRLVTVDLRRTGRYAVVTVGDDGDGIAAPDRERVFDRFIRADTLRDADGTGLGLVIARNIAFAHHGTVTIEDGPAPGANFALHLPLPD